MKITCRGCKALYWDRFDGFCYLQYKIRIHKFGSLTYIKPLEECPKPRTNKRYVELSLERSKRDG